MTSRCINNKRSTVSPIKRFGAVSAVHIEFEHIVIPVIIALKDGRTVGCNRFGVVIKLCKPLYPFRVLNLKLGIGNDRSRFCGRNAVQPDILGIHIVVDVLKIIAYTIGYIYCLIVDIDRIGSFVIG